MDHAILVMAGLVPAIHVFHYHCMTRGGHVFILTNRAKRQRFCA